MNSRLVDQRDGLRTYVVVLAHGDEAMASLKAFAQQEQLAGSEFRAIGAFSRVVVAYFDWTTKRYQNIPIDEQVEVLSLNGNVALDGEKRQVHAHIVVGRRDASAHGGHFVEGHVRPTLEIVVSKLPRHLYRRFDLESGLALIEL
jgi:predicted DNA-binding protein with PD1-like motif